MGTDFEADGGLIPSVAKTLASSRGAACSNAEDLETFIPMTFNLRGREGGAQLEVDPHSLVNMRAASGGSSRSYVAAAFGGNDTSGPRDVAACLNAKGGASRMDFESETLIAHTLTGGGFDASEDGTGRGTPIPPLWANKNYGANGLGVGQSGDPSMTLDRSGAAAISFHARQDPDSSSEVTPPLDTDDRTIGIAFDTTQITSAENRCDPRPGDACHPLSATAHPPAWATTYEVRRLTPVECARLQGVPDDYLDILYRGKPAADGPKYKALGNGFAVPVVRWVGERIELAVSSDRGHAMPMTSASRVENGEKGI